MEFNSSIFSAMLESWGLEPYTTWDEASQSLQILVTAGESTMLVKWGEESTVLYFTEPVGCLIPQLYYAAMLSK